MEEQTELIKYLAKTKSNLLKQPFEIKMLKKRKKKLPSGFGKLTN